MIETKKCLFNNDTIQFDEEKHKYYKNGKEFISVSTLIGIYKNKFDPNGIIIKKYAEKNGLTIDQVRVKWDNERDKANDKGHKFHSNFEHYVKTGEILNNENKIYIDQILASTKFSGKLFSESLVFNEKYNIAGTIDLISLEGKSKIDLFDFKTNKELRKKDKYGKYMKYPLYHLSDCNFNHYSIQLNLYAWMLEDLGYYVNSMYIFYINPRTNVVEKHKIKFMIKEINNILENYNKEIDILI